MCGRKIFAPTGLVATMPRSDRSHTVDGELLRQISQGETSKDHTGGRAAKLMRFANDPVALNLFMQYGKRPERPAPPVTGDPFMLARSITPASSNVTIRRMGYSQHDPTHEPSFHAEAFNPSADDTAQALNAMPDHAADCEDVSLVSLPWKLLAVGVLFTLCLTLSCF